MSVHGGNTITCKTCEYKCSQKSNLKSHGELVHGGKKFSCKTCKKGLLRTYEESVHIRNKFDCWTCDYQSSHKGYLTVHKELVHAENYFAENLPQVRDAIFNH